MVQEAELIDAAAALEAGGLVVFPTETFYGLAADPFHPEALARLLQLKGRPADLPVPLILPGRVALSALVSRIPDRARALMDEHWPGPLTLVLPARAGLPPAIVGPHGVGVRISSHPGAAALARHFGGPLTATSANRRGDPAPLVVAAAIRSLGPVDRTLDAGPLSGGPPSTVVAVAADGALTLLRPGACDVRL